jgi:hypothetical protein
MSDGLELAGRIAPPIVSANRVPRWAKYSAKAALSSSWAIAEIVWAASSAFLGRFDKRSLHIVFIAVVFLRFLSVAEAHYGTDEMTIDTYVEDSISIRHIRLPQRRGNVLIGINVARDHAVLCENTLSK